MAQNGTENILIETETTEYVSGSGSGPPQNFSKQDVAQSGASSSGGGGGRRGAPRVAAISAKADEEWRGINAPPRAPLPPCVNQAYVINSDSSDEAVAISSNDEDASVKSTPRPATGDPTESQRGGGTGARDLGPLPGEPSAESGGSGPAVIADFVTDAP